MPENERRSWLSKIGFPEIVGVGLVAAFAVPISIGYVNHRRFLNREVVTLEGTVIGDRYVPPSGDAGSKYFFSIDNPTRGMVGIQVMNSYEPPVRIESLDTQLGEGTRVKVNAREVALGEYKAFAHEVYVGE